MVKTISSSPPEIQYPVARRGVSGSVWVFFNPKQAVCVERSENLPLWKLGEKYDHFDMFDGEWTPVDLHITG